MNALNKAKKNTRGVAVVAAVAYLTVIGVYFFWFGLKHDYVLSLNAADWGALGDFVGGLVNPLISLSTLVVVAFAYLAQKEELASTVSALKDSAAQQGNQVMVSAIQGQIDVKSALLNVYQSKLRSIEDSITTIGSEQQQGGATGQEIFGMAGEILHLSSHRQDYIKGKQDELDELRNRVREIMIDLESLALKLFSHSES